MPFVVSRHDGGRNLPVLRCNRPHVVGGQLREREAHREHCPDVAPDRGHQRVPAGTGHAVVEGAISGEKRHSIPPSLGEPAHRLRDSLELLGVLGVAANGHPLGGGRLDHES